MSKIYGYASAATAEVSFEMNTTTQIRGEADIKNYRGVVKYR
jgi:hypothetical protein